IRANPKAIGLFLIGGLILAVAGTAVLASATWFQNRSTFISFFQESVNGLETGAPVKFQGVPIGTVTGILIQIDQSDKTFQVPVEYEIDLTRLTTQVGTYVNLANRDVLQRQITDGLRAQMQMESIVTGQLYIELSYNADAGPPEVQTLATDWPEIPTTPSLMAALGTGAGSLVADMLKVLFQVNQMLAEVDMPGINAAVVSSAEAVERLMNSPEIMAAVEQVPIMAVQVNRTMEGLQDLATNASAAIGPFQGQVDAASAELIATLKTLRITLEDTHGLLSTDSGVGYGLQDALVSLKEAADAIRLLTTSLEQNPDMLLRGRKPPEEN
ncbi:MAG: MCE family protein, partial [Gemmatimonadetes bacterium]|nr:MCE family protein [Gemmatimonadota bacterium]